MRLKDHLSAITAEQAADLAAQCIVTVGHLRNVANGCRDASPALAAALERATVGAVTRRDLRPDDWQAIWPELAEPATEGERANV